MNKDTLKTHIGYMVFITAFMLFMIWCKHGELNPLLILIALAPAIVHLPVIAILIEEKDKK